MDRHLPFFVCEAAINGAEGIGDWVSG